MKNKYQDKIKKAIVVVMGHVNHGKTSLIRLLNNNQVYQKEYGNITQHINAKTININKNQYITIIDTPGHEAFKEIRKNSVKIADMAIIVIAIDEGIQDQTMECIKYIKKISIPALIVINKIDKKDKNNIDKIKNKLINSNIIKQNKYNETTNDFVQISVKQKWGIKILKKTILKKTKTLKLENNHKYNNYGIIIETKNNNSLGIYIIVIIKNGTIAIGDQLNIEGYTFKIKLMINENNENIQIAYQSMIVKITGTKKVIIPGSKFYKLKKKTKNTYNNSTVRKNSEAKKIFASNNQDYNKIINIIIAADTYSAIDAIIFIIKKIRIKHIKVNILKKKIGNVSMSDVNLSKMTKAIILVFNINVTKKIYNILKYLNIKIFTSKIIYQVSEYLKKIINENEDIKIKNDISGRAIVKNIINIENVGKIAGCIITKGKIKINNDIILIRNKEIIHNDRIKNLKHFKMNIKEAQEGIKCGILLNNFDRFQINDIIELSNQKLNKY